MVMDELCAEADLTRGALHHHFGGKAGLFTAVVTHLLDEINQALDERFATIPILGRATGHLSALLRPAP